jgi:hypothetical protein
LVQHTSAWQSLLFGLLTGRQQIGDQVVKRRDGKPGHGVKHGGMARQVGIAQDHTHLAAANNGSIVPSIPDVAIIVNVNLLLLTPTTTPAGLIAVAIAASPPGKVPRSVM